MADQWLPPTTQTYYSQDNNVRVTIVPRDIASPLAYFEDKARGKTQSGQKPGSPEKFARSVLERITQDGHWATIRNQPLLNDVGPVSALITNSARYVVTFDNWHSMGWGDNVVVIYGPTGSVIRSLALDDLLPDYYIKALTHSASSIWWSGEHQILEPQDTLLLKVVVPSDKETGERAYVDLPVQLTTGQVRPTKGSAWQNALLQASRIAKATQAYEAAAEAAFKAPLLRPNSTNEADWHKYLNEAFSRLDPDWKEGSAGITVLRSPDARDYGPSVGWVKEDLLEEYGFTRTVMVASPSSPSNLVKVLETIVREVKPNSLKKLRIYVAVPVAFRKPVADILAPTGATFIYLDPDKPIPQRKERLKR